MLLNERITEKIKEEIKKYLETNENENTTIQNLWDATKAVLRGKFTVLQDQNQMGSQENSTRHLEKS